MSVALRTFVEKYVPIQSASFLEIGPYENPTYTKDEVSIKYLDVQPREALIRDAEYWKKDTSKIINCDFIVQTNEYEQFVNEKFDVILADNVFEHVSDPIKWLITMTKLLNDDGLLFIRLPEYKQCFDRFRTPTQFSHLISDYIKKVPDLDPEHCVESSIYYTMRSSEERPVFDRINMEKIRYWYANPHFGIHCHCYEYATFLSAIIMPILFTGLVSFSIVEHIKDSDYGFTTILRKINVPCPLEFSSREFLENKK